MTNAPLAAALRHVLTALSAIVAFLVAMGWLGQADADQIVALVQRAGEGVLIVAGAIATLTPIVTAAWSAWKASAAGRTASIEQTPGVKLVITNPNIAPAAIVAAAEDPARHKVELDPRAPPKF